MPVSPYPAPVALSFRSRVEHASAPLAERVNSVPRPLFLGGLVVVLLVGVFAPAPWGGIAFALVTVLVAWLLYLTWPRLTVPEQLMRLAVLTLAAAVTIVRFFPRG